MATPPPGLPPPAPPPPPPLPPPPPPGYPSQLPSWGSLWAPPGAPLTGQVFRNTGNQGTTRAVAGIRHGIDLYLVVIVLTLVTSSAYFAEAVVNGYPTGLGYPSNPTCPTTSPTPPSTSLSVGTSGLAIAAAVIGLAALVVIIASWLAWRSGVRDLESSSWEYGPSHSRETQEAYRFYYNTVYTFIAYLVLAIVGVIVFTVILVSTLTAILSVSGCDASVLAQVTSQLRALVVVAAAGAAVFYILLYYFSTRSLTQGIRSVATPEVNAELELGRRLILIGAFLTLANTAVILTVYVQVVTVAAGVLYVVGFLKLRSAYGRWLSAPPAPGAPPTVPFPPT